ncbi:MAG: transporter associated domain-containing protein [Pseudomonadota bacterium]|nr:transporter associated domain-containing protein [Pseudomonadota bacterium]
MSNNDKPPGRSLTSWFKRLGKSFCSEPETREELLEQLKSARSRALIDMDALDMIEGVLSVSALRVRDIMIPRAEMTVLNRDDGLEKLLPLVIDTAHSRFPVINDDKAEIIGILLAKDLLQYCGTTRKKFNIRDVLRNAVFVPESKRLNVLLKEFRTRRNHMAIVIDEYGAAAGLVTIEDVLEQIVGEIEDEYDFEEDVQILQRTDNEYTVKAQVEIEDFNLHFNSNLDEKEFDTIGGLVTNAIGHLPKRGERVIIDSFEFRVIRADSRKIRLLTLHLL